MVFYAVVTLNMIAAFICRKTRSGGRLALLPCVCAALPRAVCTWFTMYVWCTNNTQACSILGERWITYSGIDQAQRSALQYYLVFSANDQKSCLSWRRRTNNFKLVRAGRCYLSTVATYERTYLLFCHSFQELFFSRSSFLPGDCAACE